MADAVQNINPANPIRNGDANIGLSKVAKGATLFQTHVPPVTYSHPYSPSISGCEGSVANRLMTIDPSYRVF